MRLCRDQSIVVVGEWVLARKDLPRAASGPPVPRDCPPRNEDITTARSRSGIPNGRRDCNALNRFDSRRLLSDQVASGRSYFIPE
ncbi:hypothetical protein HMN09_01361500 [Mycena chlorophos]|uniref:Uncharacterized protein n=1 Tax=Mycena chlorophos TaxID=658473 RepID=A0A8H6VP01_MYCCL|nr:hypothetical protein HMN09_01361500 [Mycena chlorophos]